MRVAILGQQPFGKAVLEGFARRGHTIAGVFCAPDKPGAVDPLKITAELQGVPVFQLTSLRTPQARQLLQSLQADLGVMAYVLQFAPEDFTRIPTHGTIQYHPSLLPRHRGPSAINWPIILGETETGLTIFRPTDGLDEGPIILQRTTPIGPDESLGQVYFDRLFPMGVAALLEAAEMVTTDGVSATPQDDSRATYEGWCRAAESEIHWHRHVDQIYNLIRGCDPSPGAWTRFNGKTLQLFDVRKQTRRTFSPLGPGIGTVCATSARGFAVVAQGGQIDVGRVRYEEAAKMPAADFCRQHDLIGKSLGA